MFKLMVMIASLAYSLITMDFKDSFKFQLFGGFWHWKQVDDWPMIAVMSSLCPFPFEDWCSLCNSPLVWDVFYISRLARTGLSKVIEGDPVCIQVSFVEICQILPSFWIIRSSSSVGLKTDPWTLPTHCYLFYSMKKKKKSIKCQVNFSKKSLES
jgi:hypothetical protein